MVGSDSTTSSDWKIIHQIKNKSAIETFRQGALLWNKWQPSTVLRSWSIIIASLIWAILGMIIGVILAAQLYYWPVLNFDSQYFQFGRLRPLHTSGVIYGFVVNILMGITVHCPENGTLWTVQQKPVDGVLGLAAYPCYWRSYRCQLATPHQGSTQELNGLSTCTYRVGFGCSTLYLFFGTIAKRKCSYFRSELVLRCVYYRDRDDLHRKQSCDARFCHEVLFGLRRSSRRLSYSNWGGDITPSVSCWRLASSVWTTTSYPKRLTALSTRTDCPWFTSGA